MLKARWSDIDFDRGVWVKPSHHTKQKKTEHLPLLQCSSRASNGGSKPCAGKCRLSLSWRREWYAASERKKILRKVIEAAELRDYRMHDNRHTHASHLVSNGLSLEIVGKLLGHTNPLTTKRYAHLADSPLRAAAEQFGAKLSNWRDADKRLLSSVSCRSQAQYRHPWCVASLLRGDIWPTHHPCLVQASRSRDERTRSAYSQSSPSCRCDVTRIPQLHGRARPFGAL